MRDFHGKTFKGAPVKVELSTQSDQSAPRQHSPEVDHHSSDDHQRRGLSFCFDMMAVLAVAAQ